MNPEQLLAHYDHIADAPDAVARLRRFVLDLAVRGKLVEQDSRDEPATTLLTRILAERPSHSGSRELPIIDSGQWEGGSIPLNWCAVPLIALGRWAIGAGFPKKEQGMSSGPHLFLKVSDMNLSGNEKFINVANNYIDEAAAKRMRAAIHPAGTIIFPKIGGAIATNKRRILTRGSAIDNNCLGITISKYVCVEWAYLILSSLDFARYQAGTAVPALQQGTLEAIPIALPPLAEQHRIVAKVDELMALCDRLEAARAAREATRDRLAAASLARLNSPDPETFQSDARFALDTLRSLTTRPDQIKQLRQTILNLAVSGGLSPSGAWRSTTIKLGSVAELQNGYAFKSEWFATVGTRLLRNANVGHGCLNWHEEVRLPEAQATEYERFRLCEGDIVLSLDRPFIATGTKVARVAARDLPALLLQRVGRFILSPELLPAYLFLWINSPQFSAQIDPGRSNGVPHISSKQVEAATLVLPPLAEQHRIVAKVDELMALCDRLEATLTTASDTRRRALEALLVRALAPADSVIA